MFAHGTKSIFDGLIYSHTHTHHMQDPCANPAHVDTVHLIHTSVYQQGKQIHYLTPIFPSETTAYWPWMHNACRLYRMKLHFHCPSRSTVKLHPILRWSCGISYAHSISYYFSILLRRRSLRTIFQGIINVLYISPVGISMITK